jgi:acetoin utilization deacetylase AcuC-like enzyme
MPLLFMDPRFLDHDTGPHPESAERLRFLHERLETSAAAKGFERVECTAATREQLGRAHPGRYADSIRQFVARGGRRLEVDTFCSAKSFDVASLAAGTAASAVDRVVTGPHRQAVCLVRPPGHHARPGAAMGFCLFNNAAVAAAHARAVHRIERILIVDWDVHHGNGTQEIFYRDPNVYFLSVHRWPFYPGTGDVDETGEGPGLGTTFNLPLEFGVSRRDYRAQFESMLTDAAERCRPELVLVSAGFDAHRGDPVGSLGLETEDYEALTELPLQVAKQYCEGRFVSMLEGGYNVPILADCVECHLETILGEGRGVEVKKGRREDLGC